MKDFEKQITSLMMIRGFLPREGLFDITEQHLQSYIQLYAELFSAQNKNKLNRSNYRYARKLAGLTLLSFLEERGGNYATTKSGIVYIVENPSFAEHYKIGMTTNLDRRLASYQTYDPHRAFKVKHYEFVLDRREAEEKLLKHSAIEVENGEWIKKERSTEIFKSLMFNS